MIATVLSIAEQIVGGEVSPYEGAAAIWSVLAETARPYPDDMAVFVGLASEWQDSPADRALLDADIVEEARRYVATKRRGST